MFPFGFGYGYDSEYGRDRHYGRHRHGHGSGIVNNLIVNVHDEYRFTDHSGCVIPHP